MAKKDATREYVLKLESYSVETLPMNRLAGFVADLATVMGEYAGVHLHRIEPGSVALKVVVDRGADQKVRQRIRDVKRQEGPPEARRAIQNINKRLAEDNATATLVDPNNKNILPFPGASQAPLIGPVRQAGTLDGIPIRVGGRKERVPVHLDRFGHEVYVCTASRGVAQRIAKLLFEKPIRVLGTGTWFRWPDGNWELDGFVIQDFEELDTPDLELTVSRLRAIDLPMEPGEDILRTMAEIRNGS